MRLPCPYCGLRDAHEFSYLGDATPKRPDASAPDAADAFHDYVYLRDNPAGPMKELWYHSAGCRRWIVVGARHPHPRGARRNARLGRRRMSRFAEGGLIDRTKPLAFTFDGKPYRGYAGDTLASALLANGVRLVGRSFKYHRPRGIFSSGSEEPNALVELRSGARREPNSRATTVELYDGLSADSQNRWPSLDFDIQAVNGLFGPMLGAGFYYKTFMWPAALWEKLYEPTIRKAAGLGRAAEAADPDSYEKAFAFCDLLVVGGGASGLMAALVAGRSGARVILADEDFRLGGRLLSEKMDINDAPALRFVAEAEAELEALPNVTLMRRTTVFGAYDGGTYGAVERVGDHLPVPAPFMPRQRYWKIVAKRSLVCAGAIDRPIVFGGNDPARRHVGAGAAQLCGALRGLARPAHRGVRQQWLCLVCGFRRGGGGRPDRRHRGCAAGAPGDPA